MTAVAAPPSPFKGLAPYEDSDLDALLFFGRERETQVIAANLLASPLTVLYGPSGVGKSSVLRAGVAHRLRRDEVDVDVFGAWSELLPDGGATHVILDQFEEAFLYHGVDALADELARLAERRANVLIAIREDALAQLDVFKARVPRVLGNYLRLDHLERQDARAAVTAPLECWNALTGESVGIEPELVEAVLDGAAAADGRIEPPYLQLVLERLWEAERTRGSSTLRHATLDELGGADAIVDEHVSRALEALDPEQKDVAADVFEHLVTPSGTKIAHRLRDLAAYAHVQEDELSPVLSALGRERIVRPLDGKNGGGPQYEIFHDVLADAVLRWRGERELARARAAADRRQRRLLLVAAAAIVGVAVMALVTVFALTQRSDARAQARHARARELAATALTDLNVDPHASLRGAVRAAELESTPQVEHVLRTALLADHLRRVVRVGVPVVPRQLVASPPGAVVMVGTDGRRRVLLMGDLKVVGNSVRVAQVARGVVAYPNGTFHVALGRTIRDVGIARAAAVDPLSQRARGATVAVDRQGHAVPRLWNTRTGRLVAVLRQRGANAVEFSPDGTLLASGSSDGTTRLWRAGDGAPVRTLDDDGGGVNDVTFSPDGKLLATAGADGGVRVWNVSKGDRTFYFVGHVNPVEDVAFSPDGELLVSASRDRTARVWAVAGVEAGQQVGVLAAPEAVTAVTFAGPHTIVTAGDDGALRIWSATVDQRLRFVARAPKPLVAGGWLRGGNRIAARDAAGVVWTWRTSGKLVSTGSGVFRKFRGIAAAGRDGTVRLRGGRLLHTKPGLLDAELNPRGDRLVTSHQDGDVRVWDATSGRLVHDLRGHFGRVPTASFSPDGRWIVSAGPISAILWEAATGGRLFYLRGPSDLLTGAWFAPDSEHVLATSLDRTVRVYDCVVCQPLPRLVDLARRRLAASG